MQVKNISGKPQSVDLFNALENQLPGSAVTISVFGGYQALLNEIKQGKSCIDNIHFYSSTEAQMHQALNIGSADSSGASENYSVVPVQYTNASNPNNKVVDIPVKLNLGKQTLTTTLEPDADISLTLSKCRSKFANFMVTLLRNKIRKNPFRCTSC